METVTREYVEQARSGQSVFLPEVRERYSELSERERHAACFFLTCLDGSVRRFPLAMPRLADHTDEERRFILEYVMAQTFNILACLGGSGLDLYFRDRNSDAPEVYETVRRGLGLSGTNAAAPYSGVMRLINRMRRALYPGEATAFRLGIVDAMPEYSEPRINPDADAGRILARAEEGLEGRIILGIDIGGTDIKLALSVRGQLKALKEYDWLPSVFTSAEEFFHPLRALSRLMAYAASAEREEPELAQAMRKNASLEDIECFLASRTDAPIAFDAIGMAFPDVVVNNRIVGGESPKTLGMREALGDGYEAEFAKLTRLAGEFGSLVAEGGVFILNDGPLAAFTAGVELAQVRPEAVARGVFAHSLGTDFGSGWVTAEGGIPDIPLEVYNCILDLGSYPEREFPADDIRSINNINNGLSGTMQKFAGQSGVFRLVQKYLPEQRPDLHREMLAAGYIVEDNRVIDGVPTPMRIVPTRPVDMRKPFLEHVMSLGSRGDCPEVAAIFREIGRALGMATRECDWILHPGVRTRTLFGRLVKVSACFERMREGAEEVNPRGVLEAADDTMAVTPLMRELSINSEYTAAQFAQAVGAVHYANSRLERRSRE